VKGLHKPEELQRWVELMRSRDALNRKSKIMVINEKTLPNSDLKALGLKWENQPCKAGDARITYPQIPYGAHLAHGTRRTMLPWFCGLHGEHIDYEDSGTYSEFSAAHSGLTPGPSSPSSYSNHYGAITYAFPAAVRVTAENPISNGLIAQKR
jgi:hypothetical protein